MRKEPHPCPCIFSIWLATSRRECCCWNKFCFFFPGFEFFICIDWSRCSKASLLKATCGRNYAVLPSPHRPSRPQLSALSWSRLWLPHSRVHPLPWTFSVQWLKEVHAFVSLALSPQLRTTLQGLPSFRVPRGFSYSFVAASQPSLSHAQSCFSYRCGFQSALQYISHTDSLSLSLFLENGTRTTGHIRISLKITSSVKVQIWKVK